MLWSSHGEQRQLNLQAEPGGCGKLVIRNARMVILRLGGVFVHSTCSTLLVRSNFLDVPMFPWRSAPLAARTIRSRSFWRAAPGGSLHTRVILNVAPTAVGATSSSWATPVLGRPLGDVDLDRVRLALLERAAVAEAAIGIGTGNDHRAGAVHATPAQVLFGRLRPRSCVDTARHAHGPVDEQRLDEGGARSGRAVLDQRLPQHGGAAGHQRRGHARPAVEEEERVRRGPEVVEGLATSRDSVEDARPRRHDVRLYPGLRWVRGFENATMPVGGLFACRSDLIGSDGKSEGQ